MQGGYRTTAPLALIARPSPLKGDSKPEDRRHQLNVISRPPLATAISPG